MGQEKACHATYNGIESKGMAHLESDHLRFRGDFRLRVKFADVQRVEVDGDVLLLDFTGGQVSFSIGSQAPKWAAKIVNPPTLLDKFDVKPATIATVLDVADSRFLDDLKARAAIVLDRLPGEADGHSGLVDMIFYGASHRDALRHLPVLRGAIRPNGAIWVISPRGSADITEMDVMSSGRAASLVDVKVARFSATHTAAKLVIPVALRHAPAFARG